MGGWMGCMGGEYGMCYMCMGGNAMQAAGQGLARLPSSYAETDPVPQSVAQNSVLLGGSAIEAAPPPHYSNAAGMSLDPPPRAAHASRFRRSLIEEASQRHLLLLQN